MYSLLITISIIVSVFLVIVVLLQSSKGGGLSGSIAGGGAGAGMGTMFGTRRTADFLSKITWYLGGGLLILAIVINLFFVPGQTTLEDRQSIIQSTQQQQSIPSSPALPQAQPNIDGDNTNTTPDDNAGEGQQ